MSDPLLPYAPLNTLKPVAPDLWIVDGEVIHMSYGPSTLPFTTRMVICRLADGTLWLWSPIAADAALMDAVAALGEVGHIVSPNAIHYAYIPGWSVRFPNARVWASPKVRERAKSQGIEVRFTDDLDETPPAAWAETLNQTIFRGSRLLEEVVFLHRASRTLILADLIENFEPGRIQSAWTRFLMRIAGVTHPNGQLPLDLRLTYLGRRRAARASLQRLLDWAPDKVIIAHGHWYDRDGTAELRRAFRWLL
ncbi:DUF4336 domain-containing protein [Mameliella sp. CS4]|uniref:DUF4336 domain-containing protein n=1 Tax=Mameliella sp. CS4 TaxID=2862329 RepID=UPI001C5F221F|nr:DUF4336 domain-containing protein [Mameliella sp. CS4]MBW4981865.1 DUF4336 domain-containing protein [Mameliella sp. CS4]